MFIQISPDEVKKIVPLEKEKKEKSSKGEKKEELKKKKFKRPRVLNGKTIKIKLMQGNLYVTVNFTDDGRVVEVFANLGKSGGDEKANAEALGRMISLYLQKGGELEDVVDTLTGIKGEFASFDKGIYYSVPDAIGKILAKFLDPSKLNGDNWMKPIDFERKPKEGPSIIEQVGDKTNQVKGVPLAKAGLRKCPNCHEISLVTEGSCLTCINCGWSKCD